jgi:hypothetical protein
MASNLAQCFIRPNFEYLCRWRCDCRLAAPCSNCNNKGYREEWLSVDKTFTVRLTIMGYRLAGMPSTSQLYPAMARLIILS